MIVFCVGNCKGIPRNGGPNIDPDDTNYISLYELK